MGVSSIEEMSQEICDMGLEVLQFTVLNPESLECSKDKALDDTFRVCRLGRDV